MLKVVFVAFVAYRVLALHGPALTELPDYSIADGIAWTGALMARLVGYTLLAMLFIGIGDLFFAKWQLLRQMRMTLQELKDENKEMEGAPHMKAKVRKVMLQMSQNRLVSEVSEATVVIANPTHYAVAIRYEMGQIGPPLVVARGADARAQKIKEIARSAGVPRIENRPLARALYAICREGDEIPTELYEGVAEVLAFVYRLRQSRRPTAARPLAPNLR